MFQGRKIIVCIPAGRYRYLRALLPYLVAPRFSSVIDEIHLWVNTDVESDLVYFERVERDLPKVKRVFAGGRLDKQLYDARRAHYQYNNSVNRFYSYCTEPHTLYIKMDDDILYVHDDFFNNMLAEVIKREQTNYACLANVFNVPHVTKILQDRGTLGDALGHSPEGNPRCPVACTNGEFAVYIHKQFFDILAQGRIKDLYFTSHQINGRARIGAMAWTGENFKQFGGKVGPRDEVDITTTIPETLLKPLWIVGDALVSHFAFSHQQMILENQSDILQRYQQLSFQLNGDTAS